jgi:hypothetical protein
MAVVGDITESVLVYIFAKYFLHMAVLFNAYC